MWITDGKTRFLNSLFCLNPELSPRSRAGTLDRGVWRRHWPSCPLKGGATWAQVALHDNVISNFMIYQDRLETNSLQLFARTQNSEWFSINFSYYFWGQHCCLTRKCEKNDYWVRFYTELKQTVLISWYVKPWASAGGTGICPSLQIETKNKHFLENLTSAFICRYGIHTAQEPGSLFWCHAVVSL